MQHEKYSIKAGYLVLLWFGLMFGVPISLALLLILPIHVFVFERSLQYGELIFAIGIFLLCIVMWVVWRRSTFSRHDFVKIIESMGITRFRKKIYYSIWDYGSVYGFSDGYIGDIYFVARIDSPFFAYAPSPRISLEKLIKSPDKYRSKMATFMVGGYTPKYMEEASRIELFSLVAGPLSFDIKVKIENGKGEIPKTGNPEVDGIVRDSLREIDHFYARLIGDKNCLRMAIIGGSWQGEKFRKKILKGFKIFKKIVNNLNEKYPIKSWDDWQVKWNAIEYRFCLEPKAGTAEDRFYSSFLVGLIWLMFCPIQVEAQQTAIGNGINYLYSSQAVDGSWLSNETVFVALLVAVFFYSIVTLLMYLIAIIPYCFDIFKKERLYGFHLFYQEASVLRYG